MNALFLYPKDGSVFDRELVCRSISDLRPLFSELEMEGGDLSLCKGRFNFEGESNLVELRQSLDSIVLGREGRAALKLAFEIQQVYSDPLNITNESFSFELCVKEFASYEEFEARSLELLNGPDE
jgi:hypothetical protein